MRRAGRRDKLDWRELARPRVSPSSPPREKRKNKEMTDFNALKALFSNVSFWESEDGNEAISHDDLLSFMEQLEKEFECSSFQDLLSKQFSDLGYDALWQSVLVNEAFAETSSEENARVASFLLSLQADAVFNVMTTEIAKGLASRFPKATIDYLRMYAHHNLWTQQLSNGARPRIPILKDAVKYQTSEEFVVGLPQN